MKRILFVDDQPEVLRGLRRMLNRMEDDWEMEFQPSGAKALVRLNEEPFDCVVSDMRMPGMDGAELLENVSEQHPNTVRIILSGEADRAAVFRAVNPMHQYLSKPCDAEVLQSTVSRACALRDVLADSALNQLVSQISSLPSLPSVYMEIIEEVNSEDGSIQRVGEIVTKDAAMTAKLLQLANSAMFGLPRTVSTAAQAASLLGMETIKSLVLTVKVFSAFKSGKNAALIDKLMRHSLRIGGLARTIATAESADRAFVDDAFTAGLLHDIGKLVLITSAAEDYETAIELACTENISAIEAESQVLGTSHAAIGAYLLGLWGLPQPIVEATAFHHCPENHEDKQFTPLTAVHVANVLDHDLQDDQSAIAPLLSEEYLDDLGLSDRLSVWRDQCANFQEVS